MFTGLVTHRGRVLEAAAGGAARGLRLRLETTPPLEGVALGSSVSVQGVCLTLVGIEAPTPASARYDFDVVPETLRRTTLGRLDAGDPVNLEASLRVGDELGGHWVQGHVDGRARVLAVEAGGAGGGDRRVLLELDPALAPHVLPKGSVALDGVSLTVGEVEASVGGCARFSVYLVPHTCEVTTLGALAPGAEVNVECDVMGRWVAHHVERLLGGGDPRP